VAVKQNRSRLLLTIEKEGESKMRSIKKHPNLSSDGDTVGVLMALTSVSPVAKAGKPSEAPLIALDPAADNTDTMPFELAGPSKVVSLLNVIPGQDPPMADLNSSSAQSIYRREWLETMSTS